ncbi:hypothetical protein NDU88_002033 [Pleurodeles waltl]|uniref:Uncharacterized protein n=1 Tax=Pleurodeles waltl TaxID=8319 RepID=A0AAV7LET8_PLEWA|nr:hypothetical protein NDU88_002033 [Pleurodeles waltl]
MTPLAPSFQLPFSLSPPVGEDPVRDPDPGLSTLRALHLHCRPRAVPVALSISRVVPTRGLRHSPSAAPQAAQAVREGSRSSGPHSSLAHRRGAVHPALSSAIGGGGPRRRPSGRDPPSGRASALTGLLAAPQPAAVDFVGDPKPTSGLPGASRSGRHLEPLFTGAAGSPYEGELPAFHRFAPTDFSTGPRDTGAPCTAFFRSLGPRWLKADDGGVQSTLRVRPPS